MLARGRETVAQFLRDVVAEAEREERTEEEEFVKEKRTVESSSSHSLISTETLWKPFGLIKAGWDTQVSAFENWLVDELLEDSDDYESGDVVDNKNIELLVPYHALPYRGCSFAKILVLDLDHTLITTPLSSMSVSELSLEARRLLFYDCEFLTGFFAIASKRGHALRIATFADAYGSTQMDESVGNYFCTSPQSEIITLLDSFLPFHRAYLADDGHIACWKGRGVGKNDHIQKFLLSMKLSNEGELSNEDIILIDDKADNIAAAKKAGHEGFCIDASVGMCRQWFMRQNKLKLLLGFNEEDIDRYLAFIASSDS